MSPSKCNGVRCSGNGNESYIEHKVVSKYDTLAGVAIKYGVEVGDIKRVNNLASDVQMFALKVLRIPLPGRHPPCSGKNSSADTLRHLQHSNVLQPFQSLRSKPPKKKISSAMDTLQSYYGLQSPNLKSAIEAEGMEMAVYSNRRSDYIDGLLPRASSISDILSNHHHHNSRNHVNGFLPDGGTAAEGGALEESGDGDGEGERSNDKCVRRRQKTEVGSRTPERLMKEENGGGSSGFSPITGKGLALRPKSGSRTSPVSDAESGGWFGTIPMVLGDSISNDGYSGVRKSSSLPSLPDQENNSCSSSAWPAPKWSLKADLQVLSAASITRPITGRGNKAALD